MELNISLAPQVLFEVLGFPITNTFFWMIILSLVLIIFSVLLSNNLKFVPGKIQSVAEIIFESAWTFVVNTAGSEAKAKKIFPLVFTMFIFVLFANIFTFIPGQAAIDISREDGPVAIFRSVMSDYGIVLMMTLIAVILAQVVAISVNGPWRYLGKFFNFSGVLEFFSLLKKGKFKPAVLAQGLLDIFLGFMDLVGEVAKILSMSFRLFGNMFAGEVLGAVMLFLAPFFIPLPFLFLGLLTAFVQAFVFSVLTLVFVSMASDTGSKEQEQLEALT